MKPQEVLDLVQAHYRKIRSYESIINLLDWDQEVNMPIAGADARSRVFGSFVQSMNEIKNDPSYVSGAQLLASQADLLGEPEGRYVKKIVRDSFGGWHVPPELSGEVARTAIVAQSKWTEAKVNNDYGIFEPYLREMIRLKRLEAAHLGFAVHPYDALLNSYEPGLDVKQVELLFDSAIPTLKELRGRQLALKSGPDLRMSAATQRAYVSNLARELGFDFSSGRIDSGKHPATVFVHGNDVRIIARFDDETISTGVFLTLHEIGHALYYQRTKPDYSDTPLSEGASTGFHEGCARLLENYIAKSRPFLAGQYGRIVELLPSVAVSEDDLFRAINSASQSPLRFDADEVAYPIHIYIRFFIEKGLLDGSIRTADVPGIWNKMMAELLGVTVESDRVGCLQDVHWACGLIGYFPTYFVGSLYASAIYHQMRRQIPDLDSLLRSRRFDSIIAWLTDSVYSHGGYYEPKELMHRLVGVSDLQDLMPYLTDYLVEKFG